MIGAVRAKRETVVRSVEHLERVAAQNDFLHDDGEAVDVRLAEAGRQLVTAKQLRRRPQ